MIRTRVGYCGGTTPNPTYDRIGDHTESFQVDYDPSVISYEDLLNVFWACQPPHSSSYSTQYKIIAFYNDDVERQLAEAGKRRIEERDGQPGLTEIRLLGKFYRAEDYHQKFYLRGAMQLMPELRQLFPNERDFEESTLAARLNAYVGGHGFKAELERELPQYGLNAKARGYVLQLADELDEGARGGFACNLAAHSK